MIDRKIIYEIGFDTHRPVPIETHDSKNHGPAYCYERKPSLSYTWNSYDEPTSIDNNKDIISEDELSIQPGCIPNNATKQYNTAKKRSIDLIGDILPDTELSHNSTNDKLHNTIICHSRLSDLAQSLIATANEILTRNRLKSSRKSCALTSISPVPSTLVKVPISGISPRLQRVLDLKNKLRSIEVQYRKQQLGSNNKHTQLKAEISAKVNPKQLNTFTVFPSSTTTFKRLGLKQRIARTAEGITCFNMIFGFSYLIFVLYKESIAAIFRNNGI